jgi:signal transduction histidine kinase
MTVSSMLEGPAPLTSSSSDSDDEENDPSEHLRTQFLRRVAHDIASPAGVTLTVLDELSNGERPRPELIAMAKRSLRRLMRISDHLALVAELEAGALQPERTAVDLRALTKQALDEALAIDGRKDVVATFEPPASAMFIAGDGRLLLVVLREVIGNALKLATSRVVVSATDRKGFAAIRVDDDGPGFSEESTATLGRRFVRRSSARGLGLSLSMSLEIVRAHGGHLSFETSALPANRRGKIGAGVILMLPMA